MTSGAESKGGRRGSVRRTVGVKISGNVRVGRVRGVAGGVRVGRRARREGGEGRGLYPRARWGVGGGQRESTASTID